MPEVLRSERNYENPQGTKYMIAGCWKNVHPGAWTNPRPASRYDMAILGGGPAGFWRRRPPRQPARKSHW